MWLDAKLGLRLLIKRPGLTLAGGVGIAVAVAIAAGGYSVTYGSFLVSSLPFDEGDRIVSVEMWDSAANAPARRISRDFDDWREQLKSVQEISAFRTLTPNLIVPGAQPASIRVASMSASGFKVTRVRPLMGRYLEESDERENAPAVVVIGESVWRNRYAADPAILGRSIQLGAVPHSIVGVMPESFAFPVNHHFWTPLKHGQELMVFGRLAPGATLASAQAELATHAKPNEHLRPIVLPYARPFMGLHDANDVIGLHAMNGVVALLLVLVCLNVAILVYSRTAMRQSEITIRTALGASRGRVVGQLFIEALALSVVAALIGVAIAQFALRQIAASTLEIAAELPFWISFDLSPEAVLYAGALSVLAAAIVGILPGLKATSGKMRTGLRLGKTWTTLVVAQVGFSVALLPSSVVSAWGSIRSGFADSGFAAGEFLSAQLDGDRLGELRRRLEADPRIAGVTFSMVNPGEEIGAKIETGSSTYDVRFNRVDLDFFRTFEVPLLAGRGFEPADVSEGGPIVVNRSFAQQVFGGDALGKRVRRERWHEIVGIVSDFPTGASPEMDGSPLRLYHAAAPGQLQPATMALRVRGDPATFAGPLREIAAAVDPDVQLRKIVSLDEALRREQWIRRLEGGILTGVTLSVLLLSSAGIYALMSLTVSQRRKEIGIRTALGADRTRIVVSIFSRTLGQLAVGAVLGAAAAAGIDRNAPVVLLAVALFMMAVGVVAALGPARRCLRIEPSEALREQ